ncbi:hypothetical protein AJ78_05152 [Emergomyces pasteurianus Ep9510]|uniref:Ubiquitin-like domain-containing protein n=1 Tax=Emergomyces pasteurianus Ep9510 TaxID=1447872 RepID=A0A1J9PEQ9_9EURO|nr:hypothetical protein AJ78_05152 [Emergomyces pasteurianus Ep9510]
MSFCSAVHPTVTSSNLLRSVTTKLPRRAACPLSLRPFSSYGSSNHSSKRKLQTATAYQPYSLPESFPPPGTSGSTSESSITVENATLSKWQSKSTTGQPQSPKSSESIKASSATSFLEAEAQKTKPIAWSSTSTSTPTSTTATTPSTSTATTPSTSTQSEAPKKSRRPSRLKARKTAMHITPEAILHLRQLTDQPDPKLVRVGVKNRGCSGLSYNLEYVDKPAPFDEVVEQDGVKILIDSKALFSIIGTEMDWQEDSLASRFVFKNPNIKTTVPPANASKNYQNKIHPIETMAQHPPILPIDLSLLLTIRFSASIPDILLEIPDPTHLTAAGLKQLIRQRLPQDLSSHRLRLIHAGKALEDGSPLSSALNTGSLHERGYNTTSLPPRGLDLDRYRTGDGNGKGKGKAPVRDPPTPRLRTYIHCSIGDIILSAAELETETRLARVAEDTNERREGKGAMVDMSSSPSSRLELSSTSNIVSPSTISTIAPRDGDSSASPPPSAEHGQQQAESSSSNHHLIPPVGPRGFDRLLDAGFTPTEVSALRSQFLALQSLSHTPDTMPSGAELRRLEDIWMDEGGSAGSMDGGGGGTSVAGGGPGITNDGVGTASGAAGALDDMLWGSVMGFFWPVGCGLWLLREQGVWSWRKGLAVFVGIVVNFGFGVVRILN